MSKGRRAPPSIESLLRHWEEAARLRAAEYERRAAAERPVPQIVTDSFALLNFAEDAKRPELGATLQREYTSYVESAAYVKRWIAAWGKSFDPAELDALHEESARACGTCGGNRTVPLWAAGPIDVQQRIESYRKKGGWGPRRCPCSSDLKPMPGAPRASDDECQTCTGDGLIPRWARQAITTGDPVWTGEKLERWDAWVPEPCCRCGGWGRRRVASRDARSSASTPHTSVRTKVLFERLGPDGKEWRVSEGNGEARRYERPAYGFQHIAFIVTRPPHEAISARALDAVAAPATEHSEEEAEDAGLRTDRGMRPLRRRGVRRALHAAKRALEDEKHELETLRADGGSRLELEEREESLRMKTERFYQLRIKESAGAELVDDEAKIAKRVYTRITRALDRMHKKGQDQLAEYLRDSIETSGGSIVFHPREPLPYEFEVRERRA